MKYIWVIIFSLLLITFAVLAYKGKDIRENVCPKVKTARVKKIMLEDNSFICLPSDCVRDSKVYEIYKQQSFFYDTYRVKEIAVETLEEVPAKLIEDNMIAIASGIDAYSSAYYALIPTDGLTDNEAVIIELNGKS